MLPPHPGGSRHLTSQQHWTSQATYRPLLPLLFLPQISAPLGGPVWPKGGGMLVGVPAAFESGMAMQLGGGRGVWSSGVSSLQKPPALGCDLLTNEGARPGPTYWYVVCPAQAGWSGVMASALFL